MGLKETDALIFLRVSSHLKELFIKHNRKRSVSKWMRKVLGEYLEELEAMEKRAILEQSMFKKKAE